MIQRTKPVVSALAAVMALYAVLGGVARGGSVSEANTSIFGPNVYVFDESMPDADIQGVASGIFSKMESNQFGPERYALLFKPGSYHVTFNVGFYTHVAGLGRDPDDVHIDGGVNVNAQWMPNANATCNFWRTLENFAVTPSSTEGITRSAVSQAAPLRRLHVKGELQLFDFDAKWNAGWASGGFLADSVVDGKVVPASQQQWLSRNSRWSGWSNGVWNMVFVGCVNAPEGRFPGQPYTVVDRTPVIREKPYLSVDASGRYSVVVPSLRTDAQGVSWPDGAKAGRSIPIDEFLIAQPSTATSASLNAALAAGKHLLFTPGIYSLDDALRVARPGTIVLGLGVPSLVPAKGRPAISVADVDGVTIAGLILDAGAVKSPTLLEVGPEGSSADHSANPTFLYDLTVRTGGATPGKNDVGLAIRSNHVVADQLWLWRADHGEGAAWASNPTKNGLVVDGDDVTIYGLFNEHHEEYQTLWNGDGGRVYFYQSEMPYDVPDQSSWMSGATNGYASYKVADSVTRHEAWGVGVYAYFRDAAVKAHSAVEAPAARGVRFHNLTTVWLNGRAGSEITHVINGLGGRVYGNSPPRGHAADLRRLRGREIAPRRSRSLAVAVLPGRSSGQSCESEMPKSIRPFSPRPRRADTPRAVRPKCIVLLALARTIASSAAVGVPQGARAS
jgi:hypothetical protein